MVKIPSNINNTINMTTKDIENYIYQVPGNMNKVNYTSSAEKRYQTGKTWIKGSRHEGTWYDSRRSTLTPQTGQPKVGFRNVRNPLDDKNAKLSVRNQSQEVLMMSYPYQRLGAQDNTGAYDEKGGKSPLKTNESTSRRSLDAGPQRFEMTCRSS